MRSGTLDVPGIVGFATAGELAAERRTELRPGGRRAARPAGHAVRAAVPDAVLNGDPDPAGRLARQRPLLLPRLRGRLPAAAAGRPGHRVLHRLAPAPPASPSPPTCCSPWAPTPTCARGTLRFSLGHTSTARRRRRGRRRDRPGGGTGPRRRAVLTAARRPPRNRSRDAADATYPGGAMTYPGAPTDARDGSRLRVLAAMSGGVDSAVAAARAAEAGHEVTGVHLALSANPQSLPHRRPRLLHHRGLPRRPPRRRRDRHPLLRLGPGRALPRGRRRGLRRRVRGRPHPQPVPALQREDQVRRAARQGARPRLRRGVHRPLRHASSPRPDGGRELHRAERRRPRTRATSSACWTNGSSRTRCSRSATPSPPRTRSAPRPSAAAWPWPASPTATTSASSPTATPRASWPGGSAPPRATSSTRPAPASAATTARTASPSASARACGIGIPAADGKPRYVLDISPVDNTVTVGPAEALDVTALTAIRPRWCGTPPAGRRPLHRPAARPRRRRARHRRAATADTLQVAFATAGARHRPRPGRRPLRRHPRRRLRHDRHDACRASAALRR